MADSFEPGAAPFGNFINYYQFNPVENRIGAIPKEFWNNIADRIPQDVYCLDIGCNSGELTFALYEHLKAAGKNCYMLGIDIDAHLIHRSTEKFSNIPDLTFKALDLTAQSAQEEIIAYLTKTKKLRFDLVFCFSTTLWIHINHGDHGLLKAINFMCEYSENLVIEPQSWKSYQQAVHRVRKLGKTIFDQKFTELKIRSDAVKVICDEIGKAGLEVDEIGVSEWKRRIFWCRRISNPK